LRLERASGAKVSDYFATVVASVDAAFLACPGAAAVAFAAWPGGTPVGPTPVALAAWLGGETTAAWSDAGVELLVWPGLFADLPAVPVCPGGACVGFDGLAAEPAAALRRWPGDWALFPCGSALLPCATALWPGADGAADATGCDWLAP
jgi:hypothetical protein